jgi:hypothetical protein
MTYTRPESRAAAAAECNQLPQTAAVGLTVNNIIGTSITRGLKALETSKEKVNHAIGRCSSPIIGSTSGMAIVMPTAQHVLGFLTVVESTLRQMGGR